MTGCGTTVTRVALALVFTLLAGACRVGAAQSATPWPTAGWQTSTPEAQGMAPAALADLVDLGAANAMDSLLVCATATSSSRRTTRRFAPGSSMS
jgi:hypothetical protein